MRARAPQLPGLDDAAFQGHAAAANTDGPLSRVPAAVGEITLEARHLGWASARAGAVSTIARLITYDLDLSQ